jgi:hypothetical protein
LFHEDQYIRVLPMRRRLRYFLSFSLQVLMALILAINCNAQDTSHQNIIARIADNYTIGFPAVQQYVYDYQYAYRYRKHKAEAYRKALDDMIVNQLKRIDFFALGLNRNTQLLQSIRRTINEELVIQYYKTQFYGKYVNDDSMHNAYRQMGREVIYQQIVLAKPKHASQKYLDSVKSLANTIKTKIHKGQDFAKLAKQYSQAVESSKQGGFVPPLDWRMSLLSNLNNIIFHLGVNEERVTETKEAFHIVKVAKINRRDVQPYEDVKENIRIALDRRYSDFSYQEFEREKKNLVNEKTLQWNRKALKQLARWSNIPKFYQTYYSDTLRYAISHGRNLIILEYSKGKVDLEEYLRLLNDVLIWGRYTSISEDDIKRFILEAVRTNMIVNKAHKLNLEKDIFNPETTNPVLRNEIIRLYNLHEIEAQIPVATEKALKGFYEANKDSLYYQLAKVNIYAVVDSSRDIINEMKHRLEQNVPFEKLAREILVKTYVRGRDGTLDTYLADEPPYLGAGAFKLKLYETAGPIEYYDTAKGKQYALIKCMAIREAKQLTYDDVKNTIADDFMKYYRNKITQATAEKLKKKYVVTIYKHVLDQNLLKIGINPQL